MMHLAIPQEGRFSYKAIFEIAKKKEETNKRYNRQRKLKTKKEAI